MSVRYYVVHPSVVSEVSEWKECITIHVTCKYSLQPPMGVALNVTLYNSDESSKPINCTQAEQQNVTFCHLTQDSKYNYTVQKIINSKPCVLLTESFQTKGII